VKTEEKKNAQSQNQLSQLVSEVKQRLKLLKEKGFFLETSK
jgi:hypothetical protein